MNTFNKIHHAAVERTHVVLPFCSGLTLATYNLYLSIHVPFYHLPVYLHPFGFLSALLHASSKQALDPFPPGLYWRRPSSWIPARSLWIWTLLTSMNRWHERSKQEWLLMVHVTNLQLAQMSIIELYIIYIYMCVCVQCSSCELSQESSCTCRHSQQGTGETVREIHWTTRWWMTEMVTNANE